MANKLPKFVSDRMAVWDELARARQQETKSRVETPITVTLPDGNSVAGTSFVTTPHDIAKGISEGLARACVAARVDGKVVDLTRPLEADCNLELLKFSDPEGEHVFWHSSAHILGQVLELKYDEANLCYGPPVKDGGFYYDVHLPKDAAVSNADFKALNAQIKKIVKKKQAFQRLELTRDEALRMFANNKFKVQLIRERVADGERCTAYRCGPLIDFCTGPHVPHTGKVKFMEVTKNSSAYWQGNANNASLQRVYGISFPDKHKMKDWKKLMEEAAKRDHRKIGTEQKLFFFHPLSPGSCFFLPHGARIYNTLIKWLQSIYRERGYDEVVSPNVFNLDLWKISGHLDHYRDGMFIFKAEDQEFGMKPMNCPGHCLMFKNDLHSYRDLPIRMADFGVIHRNEVSGALTGLTRVRRFQQDDAHIFCRMDQIATEVRGVLEFVKYVYGILGFTFELQLSTRPEGFLGEIDTWDQAEAALAECLTAFGEPWSLNPADGAFYGPKIDIQVFDALKRQHQVATCQLDFQLPRRFELSYKDEDGKMQRPVMVHRAILGSVERMLAVLIEHTAGKWPFWLSPRQAVVVPVDLKFSEYADQVRKAVHKAGFFVDLDDTTKTLKKKIFEAQKAQYSFILVVGAEEEKNHTVMVRDRDQPNSQKALPLAELTTMMESLRKKQMHEE